MWTGFKRIVRAGFVGFWRSAYVSLASIFIMMVALFVIGSAMMIDQLLTVSLQQLNQKVDINVYFVTTAVEEDVLSLQTSLEALPDVASVDYTSREAALEAYREDNRDNATAMQALEEIGENPLGATLSIQAEQTDQYEGIANFLEEQRNGADGPFIDKINYTQNKQAIDTLSRFSDVVEQSIIVVMSILVVASVLITFNTIRLAIYTSREEISVMRLVGASNTYIRGPFMLQGIMYGLTAGVLALLIMYPILLWLGPETQEFFHFNIFDYFVGNFGYIFGVIVGIGVALGLISSTLAISRYLRV